MKDFVHNIIRFSILSNKVDKLTIMVLEQRYF